MKRVLLVGWDAADWKVIHPLMNAGKMPALEYLVNNGVMANLATLHPVLSPMLWTSIATGKRPYQHGVLGFSEPTPDGRALQPVTNLSRKTKAVWNILNQVGMRSNVIGWWPSHPAEPINGAMVSNHYQQVSGPLDKGWPMAPGTVHPPRLAKTLADVRFHPQELGEEHVLPFIPKAADVNQDKDRRLASCMKIIAECTSVHSAATWLMENEPWEFTAVYYDAIDHFSHGFMKYHPPRQDYIPEKDFEIYSGVVEAGYRYHDLMLARLLRLAGPDTTVIVISDHGFHPDHLRPRQIPKEPAGPALEHRDFGIFVMKGPGIKRDELLHGPNLLDITPTILTLFGHPVGDDMDGRPLLEAFEEPPLIHTVPSWDDIAGNAGLHPPERRLNPFESREALDQLVELGYIEKPDENIEKAVANTVRELHYNLARAYMDADRHGEAREILEELYRNEPGEYRFGIQLAMCHRALDRIESLRELIEDLNIRRRKDAVEARRKLAEWSETIKNRKEEREKTQKTGEESKPSADPPAEGAEQTQEEALLNEKERREISDLRSLAQVNPYALDYLMGFVRAAEGKHEEALALLARATKAEPGRPGLYIQIGETYLKMKRWEEAGQAFEKALEIDPDNPHTHLGLARSFLGRRRNKRAAAEALACVTLLYHYPYAHYVLGIALHRLGRLKRAVEAFQVAIALNPHFPEAHRRLAYIYGRRFGDTVQAAEHRRTANELRRMARGQTPGKRLATPVDKTVEPSASRFAVRKPGAYKDRITIVSGLPRSGTSLMMKMLAAGGIPVLTDGIRTADEDNPKGYLEFEPVKQTRKDASWLDGAVGKAVKMVHLLLYDLPPNREYNVILMHRNIDEVLESQRKMLERHGQADGKPPREAMRRVFQRQMGQVISFLAARPNFGVFHVDYNRLMQDPGGQLEQLAASLELPHAERMAAEIDPALYRNRHTE